MFKPLSVLVCALLIGNSTAFAQAPATKATPEDVLRQFALCDSSLFYTLKDHPNLLGPAVQIDNRGDVATIAVPDSLSAKGNFQEFKSPVIIDGLQLLSWHNEVSYDVDIGGTLFWGFKIGNDPATVAKKLNALLPSDKKLLRLGAGWARPEMRSVGDPLDTWKSGGESGTVAQKGKVERVLMIEVESPGKSSLYCSLQGSLTVPLLKRLRPDMLPVELPQ